MVQPSAPTCQAVNQLVRLLARDNPLCFLCEMDIGNVDYHLEFYTGRANQVEHYRKRGPFIPPRQGERVHLHKGSLILDVTRVVHDFVEHDGGSIEHVVKVFGDEVPSLE